MFPVPLTAAALEQQPSVFVQTSVSVLMSLVWFMVFVKCRYLWSGEPTRAGAVSLLSRPQTPRHRPSRTVAAAVTLQRVSFLSGAHQREDMLPKYVGGTQRWYPSVTIPSQSVNLSWTQLRSYHVDCALFIFQLYNIQTWNKEKKREGNVLFRNYFVKYYLTCPTYTRNVITHT